MGRMLRCPLQLEDSVKGREIRNRGAVQSPVGTLNMGRSGPLPLRPLRPLPQFRRRPVIAVRVQDQMGHNAAAVAHESGLGV